MLQKLLLKLRWQTQGTLDISHVQVWVIIIHCAIVYDDALELTFNLKAL